MRSILTSAWFCGVAAGLESFNIPSWQLQLESKAGWSLGKISSSGYDAASWYQISSRHTVFGGLIEAGVYNTEQLFYSKNLQNTVDYLPYYAPWLYRAEFNLSLAEGEHVFVVTNGITSKADIFMNGRQIANTTTQAGAYNGQSYDVTRYAKGGNVLLIKAYPTSYNKDFGLGFVDWNPYPPDNGTGVWRDVSVKQTGPLVMGSMWILNDYLPGATKVTVTLKANVTNLENATMMGLFVGLIADGQHGNGSIPSNMTQTYCLGPLETKTLQVSAVISNPRIWWPRQWGDQPLYTAQAKVFAQGKVSDQSEPTNFGIRYITSKLQDHHSDRIFSINGYPFQVRGGGWAPDVFLRWNASRFEAQARCVLDMGMNTIRLEGKMQHPEMYDIADRMGLMLMPGWECCDKWEAWSYNNEVIPLLTWDDDDYNTAAMSMRHEASVLQTHPSVLAFLIGSDYWPDERAAALYVEALEDFDWPAPIVCSAAKRGYVKALGPSGVKMAGPYDWVPPDYWYEGEKLGTAFGFGSELGAGVGTPELGSLKKFLNAKELKELWTEPDIGLYHMSTNVSSFHTRKRYNEALYNRLGAPNSLDDYLLKAQMMDYEATRAQYEAYAAKWNADRPATGLIYWMLNNAWPSLHWNQIDYYLHPGGSYFGTKVGCRVEHVVYDYVERDVYLINRSLNITGVRSIAAELMDLEGEMLFNTTVTMDTVPNTSKRATSIAGLDEIRGAAFLRLILSDAGGTSLSRNVYWLASSLDKLEWHKSTWINTPVSSYANYTALMSLPTAPVLVSASAAGEGSAVVTLQNTASVPAFFIRLNLVDSAGNDVVPVMWTDNYVTLWPHETLKLSVTHDSPIAAFVEASGANLGSAQTRRITR